MSRRKVTLITGGNAGIGLALARRLLENDPDLHLCLACRNKVKAESVRVELIGSYPNAIIDIQILDVSDVKLVYKAAKEIKQRYDHIDQVFLNAGVMPNTSVNWESFWSQLFSSKCVHMFATGDGLLKQHDSLTVDALPLTFSTNVFGHFILIRELEELLGGREGSSQIIWTSSSNASCSAFNIDNIEHRNGVEPYASSKYCVDCLSVALNDRLNNKGIYSHTTCPGLVMTNLTNGILPAWLWVLFLPILWMLRLFTPAMSVQPENGAEALVWLSKQSPEHLDASSKYHSCTSPLGTRYTDRRKMSIDSDLADQVYNKLVHMQKQLHPENNKCYSISTDTYL